MFGWWSLVEIEGVERCIRDPKVGGGKVCVCVCSATTENKELRLSYDS